MPGAVQDHPDRCRYELTLDGGTAFIDYHRVGRVRVLTHAEVPVALRGGGIGAQLTAGALDLIRAEGDKVIARCPYIAHFIAQHPAFKDLLA